MRPEELEPEPSSRPGTLEELLSAFAQIQGADSIELVGGTSAWVCGHLDLDASQSWLVEITRKHEGETWIDHIAIVEQPGGVRTSARLGRARWGEHSCWELRGAWLRWSEQVLS